MEDNSRMHSTTSTKTQLRGVRVVSYLVGAPASDATGIRLVHRKNRRGKTGRYVEKTYLYVPARRLHTS